MGLSDTDILDFIRKDKAAGIQQLFVRYYRPLVLFADEFLKNRLEAEDIVQELFVKLWEDDYLIRVTDVSLASYLYSAVRNRAISCLQKKDILRGSKELEGMDISEEMVVDIDEERMEMVMREVERLPDRTRQVVECVMLRGLKYKEAAEELCISINTVKFLLKEGTKRLREKFASVRSDILFLFLRRVQRRE
ncbi:MULTISPECIES: sigma-70 family RNA polymerase sigma factor [Butyricimonas]|uniref:sigma-70 family RNA polymerase sigma factor n=1 Tax=Butyricimonas TaxID=574697 RepID=UPI0007FB352B|nr:MULTISPECIES: sigma-70 family RNA polymerase sigma factor [Butyricimonas]